MRRTLVVNADDFGLSPGVNVGVVRAHELGIVTSASLMVRAPAAADAVLRACAYPELSLGLHVDLGEWVWRDGAWQAAYKVVDLEDEALVAAEVHRQLAHFLALVRAGPTHLDSHQHVHRSEPARTVLVALGDELGVPVRGERGGVHYCGGFYGQTARGEPLPGGVSVDRLSELLRELSAGANELGCHPAAATDHSSVYSSERLDELRTLCDPRVRDVLADEDIALRPHAITANGGIDGDHH